MNGNSDQQRVCGRDVHEKPKSQQSGVGVVEIEVALGFYEIADLVQAFFAGGVEIALYRRDLTEKTRLRHLGGGQVRDNVARPGKKIRQRINVELGNAPGVAILDGFLGDRLDLFRQLRSK